MPTPAPIILTVNGGSSSIKFAVFTSSSAQRLFSGQIERIGTPNAQLSATKDRTSDKETEPVSAKTFDKSLEQLLSYLRERIADTPIAGIGHRIVHGGKHLLDHQIITDAVLAELRASQPLDLSHLPREISIVEAFQKAFPSVPQIACFDTAFHRDMPRVAQLLPIPRKFLEAGVRRFGFHGLSYTYLMGELKSLAGEAVANGRVILAHLGSGASMAAVRDGKSIDTTMAFTPTAGLVMGTRPGDLDPGLVVYLMKDQNLSPDQMDIFLSKDCGLQGISDTSSDMRELLAARASDPRAADAIDLFCYAAKKQFCGLAAALGGIDTLVFSGGIGEHTPEVRAEICESLGFLGIELDVARNANGEGLISSDQSHVTVRVIPTDEEIVIARTVEGLLSS